MGQHQVTNKAGLVGWYDVRSDTFEPIACWTCDEPFTQKAWDDRHSDSEGNDVHAHCCDLAKCEDAPGKEDNPIVADEVIARGYEVACPVCGGYFTTYALFEDIGCEHCLARLDISGGIHAID